MTEDWKDQKEPTDTIVLPFSKRQVYEQILKDKGIDNWKSDAERIVETIKNDLPNIYERRKQIEGFGVIYAEGKFSKILTEALYCYQLGLYHSTIALCGTVAERLCYDIIDNLRFYVYEDDFDDATKKIIQAAPFRSLVGFVKELHPRIQEVEGMLHETYDIRNKYVHPVKTLDDKADALRAVNLVCRICEKVFGLNDEFIIVDGKPVNIVDYRKNQTTAKS